MKPRKGKKIKFNRLPYVSVVMPIRNEASFIEQSLRAILAQTYPKERFEIVIADGMSTDNTRNVIEEIKRESQISINVVDNPSRIAPTGLNCAIRRATGEIIVRVDGHCEIDRNYLANCVRHLLSGKAEAVGGPIETIGESFRAKVIALAMSSSFGVGGSAFRTIHNRELYVDTVAFPGYTKQIIERVGVFNEELVRNQDDEYNYRLRKMGGRILLTPDVRSRYFSRSTLRSLWRQYYQYGFWKVRVMQLHPKQMSYRQFVPALFVLSLFVSLVISFINPVCFYLLIAILTIYLLANAISSLRIALIKGSQYLLLLPVCFLIIHLSYGFGFIAGIFYFWNRWVKKTKKDLVLRDI